MKNIIWKKLFILEILIALWIYPDYRFEVIKLSESIQTMIEKSDGGELISFRESEAILDKISTNHSFSSEEKIYLQAKTKSLMIKLFFTLSDQSTINRWTLTLHSLYLTNKKIIYFKNVDTIKVLLALSEFCFNMSLMIQTNPEFFKKINSTIYRLDQKNWAILAQMKKPGQVETQVRLAMWYAFKSGENDHRAHSIVLNQLTDQHLALVDRSTAYHAYVLKSQVHMKLNQTSLAFSILNRAARIFPRGNYHQLVKDAYSKGETHAFK